MQSDEKINCASPVQSLCGVAYRINNEFRYDYAKAFQTIYENIELTDETFYNIIKSSLESFCYNKQLISNDDLAQLIICWINENESEIEQIYKRIEKDIIKKNTFEKYYRNDILEENITIKSDFIESDNISL